MKFNSAMSSVASETSNEVHHILLQSKNVMIASLEEQAIGSVQERKSREEQDVEKILEVIDEEEVKVSNIRSVRRTNSDGKKDALWKCCRKQKFYGISLTSRPTL